MKKSPQSIEAIKKACKVADLTFEYILPQLKSGVTEKEIVKKINKFIRGNSDGTSFRPIAAFGKNSSEIHHQHPTDTKLKNGDFIMFDFGAKIEGYSSDITRTLFFGKATEKQKRLYQAVLEAQLRALEFLKSSIINNKSIPSKEVDKVARNFLLSKKYPEMPHSLGHGIGKKVHSGLRLSPKSKSNLHPGMVFSIEPGIYIKNFGGVRIEDTVLLKENELEILTTSPKHLIELY